MTDKDQQEPSMEELLAPVRAEINPAVRVIISGVVMVGVFTILARSGSTIGFWLAGAWLIISPTLLYLWNRARYWPWFVFPFFAAMSMLPTALQPSMSVFEQLPSLEDSLLGWDRPGLVAFVAGWVGYYFVRSVQSTKWRIQSG